MIVLVLSVTARIIEQRMCGLAGIITFDQRLPIESKVLNVMKDRIEHRGPDASGSWEIELISPHFAAGLVHCRLSVVDLDPRANQPMCDVHGRFAIVFNGEIYNFRELRRELQQCLPEFQFRTDCDTEVIIAAFQAWGEGCLQKFNGMFSFVIVDQATRTVFAARDRMGQKPLYLAAISTDGVPIDLLDPHKVHRPIGAIAFASEIQALLPIKWVKKEIRTESIAPYLMWGYIPSPYTVYSSINSLPPGHAMLIALQQARVWRYFDPNEPQQSFIPGETDVEAAKRLVTEAVRRQLVSDVPLGCLLSGGMDSSIIAAAMKHIVGAKQEVLTFSVGFDDTRFDETPYASAVANHLKTNHHAFNVTLDAIEDLQRVVEAFGQPFADSSAIPTYHLSQMTRQLVKVALSGDGADELFGGYDRYRAVRLAGRMHPAIRFGLSLSLWQKLPGVHPKSRLQRLKRLIKPLNNPPGERYARYMQLFEPEEVQKLMNYNLLGNEQQYLSELYDQFNGKREDVPTALAVDRLTYLPEDPLTKVDRCSMRFALEVRSPFLDHDLVQFAAGLDTQQLLRHGNKTLLRCAFAGDLPANHFDRPKMGFAVPIGEWLKTDLREMLYDNLLATGSFASMYLNTSFIKTLIEEHQRNYRDHSQRLYALLVLELWHAKVR